MKLSPQKIMVGSLKFVHFIGILSRGNCCPKNKSHRKSKRYCQDGRLEAFYALDTMNTVCSLGRQTRIVQREGSPVDNGVSTRLPLPAQLDLVIVIDTLQTHCIHRESPRMDL